MTNRGMEKYIRIFHLRIPGQKTSALYSTIKDCFTGLFLYICSQMDGQAELQKYWWPTPVNCD